MGYFTDSLNFNFYAKVLNYDDKQLVPQLKFKIPYHFFIYFIILNKSYKNKNKPSKIKIYIAKSLKNISRLSVENINDKLKFSF